jgi:hypothetical protein
MGGRTRLPVVGSVSVPRAWTGLNERFYFFMPERGVASEDDVDGGQQ